jgi:hypothetical protein
MFEFEFLNTISLSYYSIELQSSNLIMFTSDESDPCSINFIIYYSYDYC